MKPKAAFSVVEVSSFDGVDWRRCAAGGETDQRRLMS